MIRFRNQKNAEALARYWNKPLDRPDWWEIKNQADEETELIIYDVIGWPFNDASELVRAVAGIKSTTITVRINSPGGDVFDGMAIYNALASHPARVVTRIEGLAASIASVIAMAGREIQAYQNTFVMVHRAWALTVGNTDELRDAADLLDKIDSQLVDIYAARTKSGKKEIKQLMAETTWMTAKEAKEKGFVTSIIENGKGAKALFDLSIFDNVPDGLDHGPGGKDLNKREIERALRDAGASASFAKKAAALFGGTAPDAQRDVDDLRNLINHNINLWR